ncbi:MAG: type IX secretion system membrane protein PorP/SprF [Bacteroidales bacterium]|nr:type IX secretion system membrane protein PorP/SprF [Bacteroidales bacterium]
MSTKFIYKESYWAGLSYRTTDVIVIFAGIRIDSFHFGYAFDYTFNTIQTHTFGSHEFMFAVKFGSNARRYRWLSRY